MMMVVVVFVCDLTYICDDDGHDDDGAQDQVSSCGYGEQLGDPIRGSAR